MSQKAMVFIDGGWLYRSRTTLFAKLGEENFEIDYAKLPKIFCVNWFRKTPEGKWLWPGFGDNSRVLKWIFERCDGEGKAVETPIGYMPTVDAIDRTGIENEVTEDDMKQLLSLDIEGWKKEVEMIKEHYKKFDRLPKELANQLAQLEERLSK